MIVDPDFFEHWKTKALVELTKRPEAPLWIMRLWAHCQTRKSWKFKLPPIALKAICGVAPEITPDQWFAWCHGCGFIDGTPEKWTVHDWKKHNSGLLSRWGNGNSPKRKRNGSEREANGKRTTDSLPDRPPDGLDGSDRVEGKDGGDRKERSSSKPRARRGKGSGGFLPSAQSPGICERMIAINAIKGRKATTYWNADEMAAFEANGLHTAPEPVFDEQIHVIQRYYGAPTALLVGTVWPRAKPGEDFRRRDLQTLLNNWASELDRAQAFDAQQQKKIELEAAGRL